MARRVVNGSAIRLVNRSAILELVRDEGRVSRADIARRLKMSLPAVMRIVEDLQREDLLKECGPAKSTGGRRGQLLGFNGEAYAVIGIDLGGSKMFGVVADLCGAVQHALYREHERGSQDTYERLCAFITQLLQKPRPKGQKVRGIGIGVPGVTVTPAGIVRWSPALNWRDFPLQDKLAQRFALPVFVENDVNLAALGEWSFGAGRGTHSMVCLAIGTGIGAGIIVEGTVLGGAHFSAGEVGYLLPSTSFLGKPAPGFGHLESLASGSGVETRARAVLSAAGRGAQATTMTSRATFEAARQGEAWAKAVVDETADYLALAIANVSTLLDPEIIIIGGGMASSADLLIPRIQAQITGVIQFVPDIVVSALGQRAAALGAVMLVLKGTTEYLAVKRV